MDAPATFVIRPQFWPLWARLTFTFQSLLLLIVVVALAARVSVGRSLYETDDEIGISVCFTAAAVAFLGLAWLMRHWSRVFLSADGICPPTPQKSGKWDRVYMWDEIVTADVWGIFPTRFLRLFDRRGKSFLIPLPIADPEGFLDAVERFAGPDHPLAVAVRTHLAPEDRVA